MVGFTARLGYQMARTPVLPLFAEELAADVWLIGLIVGASTVTGVFLKFPAGALSDVLGRRRMPLDGYRERYRGPSYASKDCRSTECVVRLPALNITNNGTRLESMIS